MLSKFLSDKSIYRCDTRPSPRVQGSGFARLLLAPLNFCQTLGGIAQSLVTLKTTISMLSFPINNSDWSGQHSYLQTPCPFFLSM